MSVGVKPTDKPQEEKPAGTVQPQEVEVLEDTPLAAQKRREKEQAELASKQQASQPKPAENK